MIELFDRQLECIRSLAITSPVKLVLYGGAAGGSKSFTGCYWQIQRRLKYPSTRGLIGRSELKNLRLTTLNTFFEVAKLMGLSADKHYTFNAQSNVIKFHNDSEIILKDLFSYPSDPNFDSLGSLEITDFFIDEVSQVSKKAVDIVQARVRYKLAEYNLEPKGLLTCNPSKGWLYNEFYKPFTSGQLPSHKTFIPALPNDNPHLPASYWEQLSHLPEEDRKRLRDGDWDFDLSIDRIFQYDDLLRCFRNDDLKGEFYITADIARMGKDRTVIGVWQGLTLLHVFIFRKLPVNEVAIKIKELASTYQVRLKQIIVDEDGIGGGCKDILKCEGFLNGSRAIAFDKFVNLKAECYFKLAELIEQNRIVFPIQYRDDIIRELDVIRRRNPDKDGKLMVTTKDEIARVHGFSPDLADMIMMRMYYELRPNMGKYVLV